VRPSWAPSSLRERSFSDNNRIFPHHQQGWSVGLPSDNRQPGNGSFPLGSMERILEWPSWGHLPQHVPVQTLSSIVSPDVILPKLSRPRKSQGPHSKRASAEQECHLPCFLLWWPKTGGLLMRKDTLRVMKPHLFLQQASSETEESTRNNK
jgi:hypothetical protein